MHATSISNKLFQTVSIAKHGAKCQRLAAHKHMQNAGSIDLDREGPRGRNCILRDPSERSLRFDDNHYFHDLTEVLFVHRRSEGNSECGSAVSPYVQLVREHLQSNIVVALLQLKRSLFKRGLKVILNVALLLACMSSWSGHTCTSACCCYLGILFAAQDCLRDICCQRCHSSMQLFMWRSSHDKDTPRTEQPSCWPRSCVSLFVGWRMGHGLILPEHASDKSLHVQHCADGKLCKSG